jgi:hypothetical protein
LEEAKRNFEQLSTLEMEKDDFKEKYEAEQAKVAASNSQLEEAKREVERLSTSLNEAKQGRQKKKPAQKPMQHAYGSGVVGDGVGGRQPLAASGRLLSLMSTFYGRLKHSHEHNPTVHDKLLLHFQNSDWPHMTIEKLKAFVETTFKGQTAILNAFYEVFREHLPAEEPKTATPQQKNAAWFCAEVGRVYGPTSPTYKGFIETMEKYEKKDRDTLGTIRAIKNLFQDSPNLIVEFANFLPEVYKKHCTMDKRPGKRKAVEQRAAGGASAAGTALLAATTPRSKDVQSAWQGKSAAQQASGDSMQSGSRQAAQALLLSKSEHDRALGVIAQCEGALSSAEAAARGMHGHPQAHQQQQQQQQQHPAQKQQATTQR